jgi:hypothetical protein
VPPTLREFDLSGTKPILPKRRKRELSSKEAFRLEEEFGPRLPSHSIRPGLFSKLCSTLPGVASWAQTSYPPLCDAVLPDGGRGYSAHPCQARTSNPSAAAKFPRRARTLTIFPCSAKPMQILPDQRFFGLQDIRSENRLTSGTVNPMVKIRRLVWLAQIGETPVLSCRWVCRASQLGKPDGRT